MNASASAPHDSGRVFRSDSALAAAPGLIRVGTRGSALAVAQTTVVAERIAAATGCDVGLVIIKTEGDVSRAPLAQLGGTGVFVSALRDALLDGRCDVAVHSLKDLPTGACPGIVLGAVPERADARDALCARDGLTLAELSEGAKVGTGSPRRAAQLLSRRPDLDVQALRGNVDTRLGRVGTDLDAVVLAAAGLDRLGRDGVITERFSLEEVPTAPGQGALAIEVRTDDASTSPIREALAAVEDAETRACAVAERAVLAALEAGCAAPVGARARVVSGTAGGEASHRLVLTAAVYSLDGTDQLVLSDEAPWGGAEAEAPAALGERLARALLAQGAAALAPLGNAR